MNEYQKGTEFLRHCLRYGDATEHQALDEKITQIQRDERCVRRAMWLMAVLSALALAGLGYSAVFIESFPQDTSHLITRIISALGLASMICLVVFVGLSLLYRMKLDQHREECRLLVTRLLDSRLGAPITMLLRDGEVATGNDRPVQIVSGGNGSVDKPELIHPG